MERVSRWLRATAEHAGRLTAGLDLGTLTSTIVRAVVDDFGAALGRVWLFEPGTRTLHLEGSCGLSDATDGAHARVGIDDAGHVAEAARRLARSIEPAKAGEWPPSPRGEITCVLTLPLIAGQELRGVLVLAFVEPLDAAAADVVSTFAAIAAAALHDVEQFAVQRVARGEAEIARAQAEASERRWRLLAESIPQLVWTAEPDGAADWCNPRWLEYAGCELDALLGLGWHQLVHPDDREGVRQALGRATSERVEVELRLRRSDGIHRWHLLRAAPLLSESGRAHKWMVTATDIDDRRRAEEVQRFLNEASAVLASAGDYATTLDVVARLAVPRLGDGCIIDVVDEAGVLQRVAVHHATRSGGEWAARLKSLPPPPPEAPVYDLLQCDPFIVGNVQAAAVSWGRNAEHIEILGALGIRSGVVAPLRARGRPLGILWLYTADSDRVYGADDLGFARELSTRIALSIDNARLLENAQQAIRLRDEFLSIASHELKTPLTPLKLQIGKLRRDMAASGTDPRFAAAVVKLEAADRQITRLTRLVEELLDVTRITGGNLRVETEPLDLTEALREVLEEFAGEASKKNIAIRADLEGPILGWWDRLRLQQVLSNLVSNALKYGEGREVHVQLRRERDRAVMEVKDQGIGIKPEDQARIFGRFERAVSSRHYGGFGLGLWITRQVIDACGGQIEVESEPGKGSRFRVTLPIRSA